jgi:2,3-bisphosphoglycerate-dependent phosphoglycerate mutase
MTHIYFVRHAQPLHTWEADRTRPLTEDGIRDSKKVIEVLKDIPLHFAISSPYQRSMDTIRDTVISHRLELVTDERLRERQMGINGNNYEMFRKRWGNFDFHEEGGESLNMLQQRNMEALFDLLREHNDDNIILGTHGTALSTILNHYDPAFNGDCFLRIIDFMPYIIRLDFEGTKCVGKEELLIIHKEFKGNRSTDK